jgi:hypothetical protein
VRSAIIRPHSGFEHERVKSPDPASLQNLNDIVLPEAAGWWPLASGWYVLLGLLLIILIWYIYTWIKHRIHNRYRRTALHQLQVLTQEISKSGKRDSVLRQIPILLKRTALTAYPRRQLASLTGKNWHEFLNSKVGTPSFTESNCNSLDSISYSVGSLDTVDAKAANELLKACKHWLKHHQPAGISKPGMET